MRGTWDDGPSGGGDVRLGIPSVTNAVRALIVTNLVVFGAMFLLSLPSATRGLEENLQRWLGIHPALWLEIFPLLPLWQLVTWGFLHSLTDPLHILFNLLCLYFLGGLLEGLIGARRFLWLYLTGLVFAGVVTLAVGFVGQPEVTTVGASGAVMCVVVACAVLLPETRVWFFGVPITVRTLAFILVGIDLFYFLLQIRTGPSQVAHLAHLSGAWWGFLFARRGWIWIDPAEVLRGKREERVRDRERSDQERLDELLDKIHRQGIHTLSGRERAFLQRVSKRK